MNHPIPEFAVLGHPNEGKSSLVSTLTEDDTVRISPYPGETTVCREFPVVIDGLEIVRFTDTPGFQNPRKTLAWFEKNPDQGPDKIASFIREKTSDPEFKDECELMKPLSRGAFIIFVVDGSRPVRGNDRAETALLALTGLPRMAVINNKAETPDFTEAWKTELQPHFHRVIVFNAHKASYESRISLLSELSNVTSLYREPLLSVIDAFKQDWNRRNAMTAESIMDLLEKASTHTVKSIISDKSMLEREKKKLKESWAQDIRKFEKDAHLEIRTLFRHNIFNAALPEGSLAAVDLFDRETWKVLGLKKAELAASAATVGAAAAAAVDLALAGHSLGIFAAIGGAVGAGSAIIGAKRLGKARVLGKYLGSYTLKAGPARDIQLMMVLLDRALIFYSLTINWAHGRRSTGSDAHGSTFSERRGPVISMTPPQKNVFKTYPSSLQKNDGGAKESQRRKALETLAGILKDISSKADF